MTKRAKEVLDFYRSENAGVLSNIARLINHGRLAGTGMFVILPVDQGFEHGPARSFAPNPPLTIRATIFRWPAKPDVTPTPRRWASWRREPPISPAKSHSS
jgi:hypothetical protein